MNQNPSTTTVTHRERAQQLAQPLEFECLDQAVLELLRLIDGHGKEVAPRGMRTKELLNVCFRLANPRARLIHNEARRWSLPLAVGKFLWHLAGRNDLSFISHYAPRWADFAVDGVIPSSCYGFKIFRPLTSGPSQWAVVSDLLRSDPYTRRVVICLYEPTEDLLPNAVDVSCASILPFLVREGRLNLTVYMRSNDSIWGLPYDCFVFTMLQELLSAELGCSLGEYVHFAASLHVYERHYSLVRRVLGAPESNNLPMPNMPHEVMPKSLLYFYEGRIRRSKPVLEFKGLASYWEDLLLILSFYKALKLGDKKSQQHALARIEVPVYRELLKQSASSVTRE